MEKLVAVGLLTSLLTGGTRQSPAPSPSPPSSARWVALAADVVITTPGKADTTGRYLRDEHGCSRRESIDPDGSVHIIINNYEQARLYDLFRGAWTARPIRAMPGGAPFGPSPRPTPRLLAKLDPVDGFEVYETEITVRSPKGDSKETQAVAPALNSLVVRRPLPPPLSGRVERIVSITLGPQPPEEFVPPPTANVIEQLDGFGGGVTMAMGLRVTFVGQEKPIELTAIEGQISTVKGPDGDLALVPILVEGKPDVVRIRVLRNAKQSGVMSVAGDELDAIDAPLGTVVSTTRLAVNLAIRVTRIGSHFAR